MCIDFCSLSLMVSIKVVMEPSMVEFAMLQVGVK